MTRTAIANRRARNSSRGRSRLNVGAAACVLWAVSFGVGPRLASAQLTIATRIEGVAAAIGGTAGESADVILQSDVELRARMLLLGRDERSALHLELPTGLLSAALRELIGEKLIAREAERVQITRPTQAMVAQERQRLIAAAGGIERVQSLLARVGASASEIDGMAVRRALVGAFLRANLEGTTVITDREIDAQIAREGGRFSGPDRIALRAQVRATLTRETLARNIERWVRVLRARVPVRIYAAFESS